MSSLTQTPAWQILLRHRQALAQTTLSSLVLGDAQRLDQFQVGVKGLRFNYALQYANAETLELLVNLGRQQNVESLRDAMERGDKINLTENRAVLHTALRQQDDAPRLVDGKDVMPEVRDVRHKMADFANQIRSGAWVGSTGKSIKHVVNIGIGGSDLGPRLVVSALESFADGPTVHFVANADAADLLLKIKLLDPAETLFVVVSKTFTTQETILNAKLAREWIVKSLGEKAIAQHFIAVSVNIERAKAFGIAAQNIFPIWDWVGGRFSLWSAVGLSIILAIGVENFDALCAGAAAMDNHFRTAPLERNMPVLLALLGIWQRNFLNSPAIVILPYSERLIELPHYLQQLDMESNGKSVTRDGVPITDYETAPLLFGERGTVGQHSFHQWLHQSGDKVPCDFVGVVADDLDHPDNHRALMTNMVAQAGALAFGRTDAAKPHEVYPGGRSSNMLVLDRLDPYHLGLLLALYEHKIFVQGAVWNINSFDQPGVELGKQMAKGLEAETGPSDKKSRFVADFLRHVG